MTVIDTPPQAKVFKPGSTLLEGWRAGVSNIPRHMTLAEIIEHDHLHICDAALDILRGLDARRATWLSPDADTASTYLHDGCPADQHIYRLHYAPEHPGIVLCSDTFGGCLVLNPDQLPTSTIDALLAALAA